MWFLYRALFVFHCVIIYGASSPSSASSFKSLFPCSAWVGLFPFYSDEHSNSFEVLWVFVFTGRCPCKWVPWHECVTHSVKVSLGLREGSLEMLDCSTTILQSKHNVIWRKKCNNQNLIETVVKHCFTYKIHISLLKQILC